MLVVLLTLLCNSNAVAQQRAVPPAEVAPDAWELVQDTLYVLRWYPNDTIPRGMICASYEYTMTYDSLCAVEYILTEWKRNGVPLRMPTWQDNRIVNAPAAYLNANNRTEVFTCRAGDTLSFFRWFNWHSLIPNHHDVDGYAALDTLDYTMELVRVSDSARVAVIDSMGALPRVAPGRPTLYGARPIMAMATYVVPPSLEGTKVFMRFLVYHRGSGAYWFTRRSSTTTRLSGFMGKPWYKGYIDYYSPQGLLKRVREQSATGSVGERIRVVGDGPGARAVRIEFNGAPAGYSTSILVCDMNGQTHFYPVMWASDAGESTTIPYQFTQGGAYLIALIYQDRIQEVVRWNVTN